MTLQERVEAVLRRYGVVPGLLKTQFKVGECLDALYHAIREASPEPSSCRNCGKNPPHYCYTCWEQA